MSREVVLSKSSSIAMQNCNHEEADTRIVVRVMHALQQGLKTIQVRIVDTDVIVILVGTFHDLTDLLPTSGSPLAWARITGFTTSTLSVMPGGATITIITCVSRILQFRYNLRLQRQEQKVVLAGVAGL